MDHRNDQDINFEEAKMKRVEKRIDCAVCMYDAPHWYCCRLECGEHEFCRNCKAECRQGDDCHEPVIFGEHTLTKERDENGID